MGFRPRPLESLVMHPVFWREKRVLVTGHTGFKGSWLSLWLQELGAEVSGYALQPPTQPSLFELAGVARGMRSIIADIRDEAHLKQAVDECRPEIIFHMAAQPLVHHSYEHPVETYAVNVMGTVNLLEAVRRNSGVRAVVNVTTDKCYENREWTWPYRESDAVGGCDPYSSSKACAEIVSAAYRSSFLATPAVNVALATARAGNVIGGGDWSRDRLVPDILDAFQQGRPAAIRNPHAVRPWQHVLEPLRGYLMLAEQLHDQGAAFAEAWNFGPFQEDARPVDWLAGKLAELWGDGAVVEQSRNDRGHEAGLLQLDASKARNRLDWQPVLRLSNALGMTVDWAKARMAGEDAKALTVSQIHSYQAIATA